MLVKGIPVVLVLLLDCGMCHGIGNRFTFVRLGLYLHKYMLCYVEDAWNEWPEFGHGYLQYVSIGSDNGLEPNRRQAIFLSIDDRVAWPPLEQISVMLCNF